jgi:hypothetical protein
MKPTNESAADRHASISIFPRPLAHFWLMSEPGNLRHAHVPLGRERLPLRVTGCLPEGVSATAAVPQIGADLLHRASRRSRAQKPTVRSSVSFRPMQGSPLGQPVKTSVQRYLGHDRRGRVSRAKRQRDTPLHYGASNALATRSTMSFGVRMMASLCFCTSVPGAGSM